MAGEANRSFGAEEVLWNLDDCYAGFDDPALTRDMARCRELGAEISSAYAGRVAGLEASGLLQALSRLEEFSTLLGRMGTLAQLYFSTHVNDPKAGAFLQKMTEFASEIGKEVVFFDLEWANTPDERAQALIDDPTLAKYRHYLTSARRYRPHLLSEAEERLLMEFQPVGHASWVGLFEKVMAAQRYGDHGRTQEEVLTDLYSPDREVRRGAAEELTGGLKSELPVLTHTMNTVLADKMIEDRVRRYPGWVSSMNLSNELDDQTVEALISSVIARYDIVERYYRLKKRILGIDALYDYDRYAPLPHLPRPVMDWNRGRDIVLQAFGGFSPKMAEIAGRFFEEKWIHAPVMPGKTGGAFAHPAVPEVHPYVLVNYTGKLRDVETVAHELGHGVHQVLASAQGYFNSHTPLVLAETASVFAEMLVFKDLVRQMENPADRLGFIAAKVESVFATVFRQVAMNRFEDAIHNRRREEGELAPDDFSRLWLDTQQAMFGDSVTLTEDYGVWWSYIGHFIHSPGYVYAYAFGELLVLSLYALHEQGVPGFTERYLDLLSAGGSDTPYALLAAVGIDLRDPQFWARGLSVIEDMVAEIEQLDAQVNA